MNQAERRRFLIEAFASERPELASPRVPANADEQRSLLRALMNTRQPGLPSPEVLAVQDAYLQERLAEKGVTRLASLTPLAPHTYLWQGDITTLEVDAIVNAANSGMTGCWVPGHTCIDNCIHTFAGVQLRAECAQAMERQGHEEPTGMAKVTGAYNLPCRHAIHTVGPIAQGHTTPRHCAQLARCYTSCYMAAREAGDQSIAFCCISTGIFGFPATEATRIATSTVANLQADDAAADRTPLDVVFNVFLDSDRALYQSLLG